MPQVIDVPGQGQVEFPDGMSDDQIVAAIKRNSMAPVPQAASKPEFSLPGFGQVQTPQNEQGFNLPAAVIGAGRTLDRITQGVRQANLAAGGLLYSAIPGLGGAASDNAAAQAQQSAQMTDEDARYKQLQDVHPGSTLLGSVAPLLPMAPEGLVATGALSYGSPLDRAKDAGGALAGGLLAKGLGGLATKQYDASKSAVLMASQQNAVRDATLKAAQDSGLSVPPSTVNPSLPNRVLESIGGKAATQQQNAVGNAGRVDSMIRDQLGMAPNAPITTGAMQQIRNQAFNNGYAPLKQAGQFPVSKDYQAALDAITARNSNAAQSFPGAATPDIQAVVDSFRPPNGVFDAGHAVDATRALRTQAGDLYLQGNGAMAKAKTDISKAIEDELERQLGASGQNGAQLLQNFKSARQTIAQAHTVEDAIREGSGSVEASSFGKAAQRGDPLSGNLKTIGEFANVFPKANQKVSQIGSSGVSNVDAGASALLGLAGGAAGGLWGATAGALPFVARPAARSLMLSQAYQALMAKPKYATKGLLGSRILDNPLSPYVGGLLGYEGVSR